MAPISPFLTASVLGLVGAAASISLSVASSGGNATSPFQYGIMFEDISHSGDGGIYAELIQNRAFQGNAYFPSTLEPWTAVGNASLALENTTVPLSSALVTSCQVTAHSGGTVGIKNPGWWGMSIKAASTYVGSFWTLGEYRGSFTAMIVSDISGETLASADIMSESTADAWTQHNFTLRPVRDAANTNNSFVIRYETGAGSTLNFNLISLFPPTYKNRPNGNRPDIMQALKELNPSYLRMPGGNNLEGEVAPYWWNWTETLGPLKDRPGRPGTWGYENTDGLGLVEYLHWCQDLGMEPVLAVWDGLYLNKNILDEAELQPYVQAALNELEFCMGNTSTTYGALRARLGYPEPFPIKYVEVGNEDDLSGYETSTYKAYRFAMFYDAITAAYPDIKVMASYAGYLYGANYGDYHEYTLPDVFASQFGFFDNFNASRGNQVMVGEFATVQNNTGVAGSGVIWSNPKWEYPYWIGSVSEAIFALGTERNADKMFGASYAPLLQNLNSFEWTPDLISFTADPAETVLSTSYQVIKLLSNNRMTTTLPSTSDTAFGPAYWVVGKNEGTDTYIFKAAVYNTTDSQPVPFSITFDGVASGATAELTVLTADSPWARNMPGMPEAVITNVAKVTAGKNGSFVFNLPELSVALLTSSRR